MNLRRTIVVVAAFALFAAVNVVADQPGITPGPGVRYATDAYPGFDREDEIVKPSKKEPRWFSFITGPKMPRADEQFAWAQQCEAEESWKAALKAYDALVREWPASPEAPKAQKAFADILLNRMLDYGEAFAEYRYLLDFYSLDCDYNAVAELMYKVAELMRAEGKTVMFFRFANTVDVRRAYEALVLRSPGSAFVPQAMLTIASLREDEQQYEKALAVYENIRNLYPDKPEARTALHREGRVRMQLLADHGYNRTRVADTMAFLKQALRGNDLSDEARTEFEKWLGETSSLDEEEAYAAARFYDSRTRTRRSAVSAYERFLKDYPASAHADEVRARLNQIKEGEGK